MNTIVETMLKSPVFDDEIVVTISHLGFIERTSLAEIRSLAHRGVGIKAFFTRDDDYVKYVSLATMQSVILFFTSSGLYYWLKVCDIPESNNNPNEYTVQELLKIDDGDNINVFINVKDYTKKDYLRSHYFIFCTKNGVVKRTCLLDYFRHYRDGIRPSSNCRRAINIMEEDTLVGVVVTNGNDDLMLASSEGHAIRFNESKIRIMGRNASGVLGLRRTDAKDEIVGIIHINDIDKESVMFICDNGYGIRVNLEDFRITWRANLGLKVTNVTNKTGKVVAITTVSDDNDLLIFNKSDGINQIKVKNVPIKHRTTQCVKLIDNFPDNDQIVCVLKVDDLDKPEDNM